MMNVPSNPVKRPEHPIFLESSHESVPPSTARVEPTESLTPIAETNQKQQHPTISKTDVIKTQKPQTTQPSTAVNQTTSQEQPVIVTRVDSSVTKVTSTVVQMLGNKASSQSTDLTTQFTKDATKTTTSAVAKDGPNATVRMKPKEVSLSFRYYQICSRILIEFPPFLCTN